ncbi:hypothetical protein [Aliterella atlantica]|uniref:hypothetical protein n=1 Tax=Aliterella atlantica TaxID=1827278 RepID=UPI000698BCC1|nr:hypothetical protein [Aliterella atlantica]
MVRIPQTFRLLDVPLPPMLLELAGANKEHRFVALYYWYGKPTWSDSNSCTSFPLYTVWQPYIQHQAIAHQLSGCDLGSDDKEPTHALLCDALEAKVYVAAFEVMLYFLNSQQPKTRPMSVCYWEAVRNKALAYTPVSFDAMQKTGMLEMFVPPTLEHLQRAKELVVWLDRYV